MNELKEILIKENIKGIAADSRECREGYLFVAVKGEKVDGHDFVDDAVTRGAKVVILQKDIFVKQSIKKIIVDDTHKVLGFLSNEFFNYPFEKITNIGITGTNGKTTTTYLLKTILEKAGKSYGLIGTIKYEINNRVIPAVNTTPGPPLIYRLGADMVKEGVEYCIMEVSSHALLQDRISYVPFAYAVFTNLTQDHLDYHKTIKNYFKSKMLLFENLSQQSWAVLNQDEKYFSLIKKVSGTKNILSYGFSKKADVRCDSVSKDNGLKIIYPKGNIEIKNQLIGYHNILNLLAAFSVAYLMQIPVEQIKQALEGELNIPGRLEKIEYPKQGIKVFVDYAHTPDGLKQVLKSLKEICGKGRLLVVFGCGGDRDKGKRKKMGFMAWRYADFSFVTTDNPRSEDPQKIANQILTGFLFKKNVRTILDRKQAIAEALKQANKGDVVLIAGKGHETYQVIGNITMPFNDKEVVKEIMQENE